MPLTTKKTAPAADTNGKDDPGKPQDALTAIVAEISKSPPRRRPTSRSRAPSPPAGTHAKRSPRLAGPTRRPPAPYIPGATRGMPSSSSRIARGELHKAFREHPITDDEPLAVAAHDAPPPSFVSDGAAPRGELLGTISDVSAAQRLAVACSPAQRGPRRAQVGTHRRRAGPRACGRNLKALTTTPDLHTAAAERLACRFVQELLAADYRLGKAYALGWDMATLGEATTYAEFSTRFTTAYPRIRERLGARFPAAAKRRARRPLLGRPVEGGDAPQAERRRRARGTSAAERPSRRSPSTMTASRATASSTRCRHGGRY